MAYKNNLLEYYGGGSVPYRQGYQGGGVAQEEADIMLPMNSLYQRAMLQDKTGEVSPWFPSGKFLGYDVPSGTGTVADILASLAIGGLGPATRSASRAVSKAFKPSTPLVKHPLEPSWYRDIREMGMSPEVFETNKAQHKIMKEWAELRGKKRLKTASAKELKRLNEIRDVTKYGTHTVKDPKTGQWKLIEKKSIFDDIDMKKLDKRLMKHIKEENEFKKMAPQIFKDISFDKSKKSAMKKLSELNPDYEKLLRNKAMLKQLDRYKQRMVDPRTWKELSKSLDVREVTPLMRKWRDNQPNIPLATLRALMDEESGGEGFQKGGSVGNSLLGMQYGGYAGGSRALSNIGRFRSISKATKDVQRRAKQIKSKKKKAGFFGKVLGKAAEWGTGALLGATLGPGLGLLAAKTIGSGIGGYFGAKLGYGDKVGTGLDKSKWLAGEREKLGAAEGDLGDLYMDIAGKQASATAKAGGTKFLKETGAKTWGDYAQARLGVGKYSGKELTPFNEGAEAAAAKARAATPDVDLLEGGYKPAEGTDIFGFGEMNRSQMAEGMPDATASNLAAGTRGAGSLYETSPSLGGLNIPSMGDPTAGADPFEYAQSGFGAQAGQQGILGGLSSLAEGETNFLQQQPWAQQGYGFQAYEDMPSFGEDLITGQYSGISGAYAGPTYNEGGMVRDDRALIDMLYRR